MTDQNPAAEMPPELMAQLLPQLLPLLPMAEALLGSIEGLEKAAAAYQQRYMAQTVREEDLFAVVSGGLALVQTLRQTGAGKLLQELREGLPVLKMMAALPPPPVESPNA